MRDKMASLNLASKETTTCIHTKEKYLIGALDTADKKSLLMLYILAEDYADFCNKTVPCR